MNDFGKSNGGGRRSASREAAPLTAVFTTITRSHRAIVIDVSATGARLRGTDLPQSGESLEVSIETVRTFGTVIWSHEQECGVAFESALAPREVHLLQQQVRSMAGLPPQVKAALDDWLTGFAR